MASMFDYDDSINLAYNAKIAGKSLIAAKHELLSKTGDFLFLAHSDREFAYRCQFVEEDIEKIAHHKLANVSDSKAKLVRAAFDEWQLRHANCDMCKTAATKTAGFFDGFCHGCGQALGMLGTAALLASKNDNSHNIFCGGCKSNPHQIGCSKCNPYESEPDPNEKPVTNPFTNPHGPIPNNPHEPIPNKEKNPFTTDPGKKPYTNPNKKPYPGKKPYTDPNEFPDKYYN